MAEAMPSLTQSSEEVFDVYCVPCLNLKRTAPATKFCISCRVNLCCKCVSDHDKFQMLKGHTMTDQPDRDASCSGTEGEPMVSETCSKHPGIPITIFCVTHDVVVCNVCVGLQHRSCQEIEYIPRVAKGTRKCRELSDIVAAAKTTKEICDVSRKHEEENIDINEADKVKSTGDINEIREKLVKRICELGQNTIVKVNAVFENQAAERKENIKLFKDISDSLDNIIARIEDQSQPLDDANLFILMKTLCTDNRSGSRYLQNIRKAGMRKTHRFTENHKLLKHLEGETFVGDLEISQNCSTMPLNILLEVAFDDDKHPPDVNGTCTLEDGTFVITDYNNCCLKRYSGSFGRLERLAVEGHPFGVCRISSSEIATSLAKEKLICFVSVSPTLTLTKCFTTKQMCRGLVWYNDELLACCGGGRVLIDGPANICAYKRNGKLIRTISKDDKGRPMFVCPRNIIVNDAGNFFITDSDRNLLEMDAKGNVRGITLSKEIESAYALDAKDSYELIVTAKQSCKVFLCNVASNEAKELVGAEKLKKATRAVLYDKETSLLLCFFEGSTRAQVFVLN